MCPGAMCAVLTGHIRNLYRMHWQRYGQLDGSVEYKFLKRLLFNLKLDPGSEVDVFIKCDSEPEFEKKISFTSQGYRTQVLNITPARCQRYRFRLEGKGPAVLIAMSKYIGYGSDIHGSI